MFEVVIGRLRDVSCKKIIRIGPGEDIGPRSADKP